MGGEKQAGKHRCSFYALAMVSPVPEVKEALDTGVVGFRRVVALLQRALPNLTHEDLCWRLHLAIKLWHQNRWDTARLSILSEGDCNSGDETEALARAIAFAEAALMAPSFSSSAKSLDRRKRKTPRTTK
jgi:hypothetical protein